MAYDINEYPEYVSLARTPILYMVMDTVNHSQNKFHYIAEVWLWQGALGDKPQDPEYELQKPPNTVQGSAIFDIRTLTTDWHITPEYAIGSDPNKTTEMYVWAQVAFGYTYVDGTGTIIKELAVTTANAITVYNGYNYYMEGLNYTPTEHHGITEGGYFMTDRPLKSCVPQNTSMNMFVINEHGKLISQVITEITTTTGVYEYALEIDVLTSEVTAIGSGTTEMIGVLVLAGGDGDILSYRIWGADELSTVSTKVYEFTVDCNESACKYGFKNMQFLNRYGVWDNLIFYGTQREDLSITRSEIIHSPLEIHEPVLLAPEFYLNTPYGQFHDTLIHGRETLTLNTGWISEEWNEVVKQMMLTQFIYDPDTQEPYTQKTANTKFKTSLNDGLINYTFIFNKAYNSINTIN